MSRSLFSALVIFTAVLGGCASYSEVSTSSNGTRTERRFEGWAGGMGAGAYGSYPYGHNGSAVIYDRGSRDRQPEIRVYDTSPAPVLVRKYDRQGNVIQMYWVCPGGGEPVAGKC